MGPIYLGRNTRDLACYITGIVMVTLNIVDQGPGGDGCRLYSKLYVLLQE